MAELNIDARAIFSRQPSPNYSRQQEIEQWVVNTVKLKMVNRFQRFLEKEGRVNLRKLFLAPVFTICELENRVNSYAPEMKTLFYKVMFETITQAEKKLVS